MVRARCPQNGGNSILRGRHLSLGEETFIGLCRSVAESFGPGLAA